MRALLDALGIPRLFGGGWSTKVIPGLGSVSLGWECWTQPGASEDFHYRLSAVEKGGRSIMGEISKAQLREAEALVRDAENERRAAICVERANNFEEAAARLRATSRRLLAGVTDRQTSSRAP